MIIDTLQTIQQRQTSFDFLPLIFSLIAILVAAWLGFGFDRLKENIRFKNSRKYFFHSLYMLQDSVRLQINHFNKYLEGINSESDHLPYLDMDTGFNLKNINIVSKEDLFKIFITKRNKNDKVYLDRFNLLLRSLEVIQYQEEIARLQEKNLFDANNRLLTKYDGLSKKIRETNNNLLTDFGTPRDEGISKDLVEDITILNSSLSPKRKQKHSIFIDMSEFMNPLSEIVNIYNYVPLMVIISDIKHTFYEIKMNRESLTNKMNQDVELLSKMRKDMISLLILYKKYLCKDMREKLIKENNI